MFILTKRKETLKISVRTLGRTRTLEKFTGVRVLLRYKPQGRQRLKILLDK